MEIKPGVSSSDGGFYEIEYDSGPIPGVGRYVLKPAPQKIAEPAKDGKRELFGRMRDIARAHRSAYDYSRFFDRRVQDDSAAIFHKQALFMKDFVDDYAGSAQYSQYFPCYQMMGYEQLRTYFTWRAQARNGSVANTSLSYAFLYIYELLGNIGAASPLDGLEKLMAFREAFRIHNSSIDKYLLRWLRDYHIYYELPHTFKEFVERSGLDEHYPGLAAYAGRSLKKIGTAGGGAMPGLAWTGDDFDLFCSVSRYNIKKSVFFTDETSKMVSECFAFVMGRVRQGFEAAGMDFDNALFRPTRKISVWRPFRDALFHNWLKQPDRQVVFSKNAIYMCRKNEWMSSTVITTEKGRQFIGYVMKQMESDLRKLTKYKFKLTANTEMMNADTIRVLAKAGVSIEFIVPAAVAEYYREATKTVVMVDRDALARIRREALATQESLIVEEQAEHKGSAPQAASPLIPAPPTFSASSPFSASPTFSASPPFLAPPPTSALFAAQDQDIFADATEEEPVSAVSAWDNLKNALSEEEIRALAILLVGGDLKTYADGCGAMIEVLADGINEKATDRVGDSLMDEDFVLYEDYITQVKELTS